MMQKVKTIISFIRNCFLILSLSGFFSLPVYAQTASLLPNAEQTFLDANGNPLSNGTVTFYVPNTSTLKATWRDANRAVQNTNPVQLDAAGRAIIYGNGNYRQLVKDSKGNTIWDQATSSTAIPLTPIQTGDGDVVGTVKPWAGIVAPSQYVFAYGQEISRSTYALFFATITITQNASCTSGSPTLSNLSDTTQIPIGADIENSCLSPGATVLSKTSTTVTASSNAISNATVSTVFFPWGNGNGSTTFNVPDLRGGNLAGRDNMGGVAAGRLTNGANIGQLLGVSNFNYVSSATPVSYQVFTSGSGIYTTATGATKIVVTMVGGGAGGGGGSANNGTAGGNSTFDSWSAVGGALGLGGAAGLGVGAGGSGGASGSGTQLRRFTGGYGGAATFNGTNWQGGGGGVSCLAAGSAGVGQNGQAGIVGPTNSGAGGSGGSANSNAGSGGGAGECVQFEISSPAASYSYAVGAAGTGGAAGGAAGANGAAGYIIVAEYTPGTVSTTSFQPTTSGTTLYTNTINLIVKIEADANSAEASGVLSLGGMTGVIACGSGINCSGNIISVTSTSVAGSNTQLQFNNSGAFGASANLTWVSPALTIGVAGSTTGQLKLTGSTSGTITVQGQAVAGTFNWNLPTSAGSSGNVLLSGGGGASPMTWTTTTFSGLNTVAAGQFVYASATNSISPSYTPVFGAVGGGTAKIGLSGTTSGTITIQPQDAAGTYNFNLPTSAGISGQTLQSGGGGSTAMSFAALNLAAGSNIVTGTLPVGNGGTGDTGGAWTSSNPAIVCGAGTMTSGTATLKIKQIGKVVFINLTIAVTTNGTCATSIGVNTSINSLNNALFAGRNITSGAQLLCNMVPSSAAFTMLTAAGAYPVADGQTIACTGVYEAS